jgi:hypothetical protein
MERERKRERDKNVSKQIVLVSSIFATCFGRTVHPQAFKHTTVNLSSFLNFKVIYLNAWGWSVRPKHVAYIAKLINFAAFDGTTYVSFNTIHHNAISSTKKKRLQISKCERATPQSSVASVFDSPALDPDIIIIRISIFKYIRQNRRYDHSVTNLLFSKLQLYDKTCYGTFRRNITWNKYINCSAFFLTYTADTKMLLMN